jgi:hypothetical protein
MDDKIKEAFSKVKEDIFTLGNELQEIRLEIVEMKKDLKLLLNFFKENKEKELFEEENKINSLEKSSSTDTPTHIQTDTPLKSTNPTHSSTIQHIQFSKMPLKGLKRQDTDFSTGNEGVPTDRQTDRQTDQQTHNGPKILNFDDFNAENDHSKGSKEAPLDRINEFNKAAEILSSLDDIKKGIRLKFKQLTSQEIAVFSLVYNLEEAGEIVDYKVLSNKLKLSESSVRDYIGRIIKKGIPIRKEKLNNKQIILSISPDLKKIASLETILRLREI